jgi:hypothetical protein
MDGMTPFLPGGEMSIEDRIEQLARLALVILLIVTLGSISHPKTQAVSKVKRPEHRASTA